MSTVDHDTDAFFSELENDKSSNYMKCSVVDAFDDVFNCYRVREQAKSYYRYGTKKNCEAKYEFLKLCISTKVKSAAMVDSMLRANMNAKIEKKTDGPSSEDVWEKRL